MAYDVNSSLISGVLSDQAAKSATGGAGAGIMGSPMTSIAALGVISMLQEKKRAEREKRQQIQDIHAQGAKNKIDAGQGEINALRMALLGR